MVGAPCAGLAPGGRCPLADGDVDLVVDVRRTPGPMTAREAGLLCGMHSGVPTLVAGSPPTGATLPDTATCEAGDLAAACAEAIPATGAEVRRAVTDALAPILRREGVHPAVQLAELDGTVHLYISVTHALAADHVVLMRRMAWLAYTRATRGRVHAVVHVAHHPGPQRRAAKGRTKVPSPRAR